MSLDMWLNRKVYIGANYNFNDVEGTVDILKDGEKLKINFYKIVSITERVGEWHGADSIHLWFVENVQDDVDNCAYYYVRGEQLKELYELCKDVLEKNSAYYAADNLPVADFTPDEDSYISFYWEDLENTVNIIEAIMVDDPELKEDYEYLSSW